MKSDMSWDRPESMNILEGSKQAQKSLKIGP